MLSKNQDRAAPRPPSCVLVLGVAAIAMLAGCGGDEGPVGRVSPPSVCSSKPSREARPPELPLDRSSKSPCWTAPATS